MVNLPETYGAVLLGGFIATILSGVISAQVFGYVRRYSSDTLRAKAIVALIWILDFSHTVLICTTSWIYMIHWIGKEEKIDIIFTPLAISVALTAFLTLIVQCFFMHRIHKLTHNDWRLSLPIVVFAFLRLIAAIISTFEMFHLQTWSAFRRDVGWVFTIGLSLSCVVDVLITVILCVTLRTAQGSYSNMNRIINFIILYTLENNSLSSAATITSMICWMTMPNLFFLGIHFVLSKLYVNSLLATLNSRKKLQEKRTHGVLANEHPVAFPGRYRPKYSRRTGPENKLEIIVDRTIEHEGMDGNAERSPPSDIISLARPNHISCPTV